MLRPFNPGKIVLNLHYSPKKPENFDSYLGSVAIAIRNFQPELNPMNPTQNRAAVELFRRKVYTVAADPLITHYERAIIYHFVGTMLDNLSPGNTLLVARITDLIDETWRRVKTLLPYSLPTRISSDFSKLLSKCVTDIFPKAEQRPRFAASADTAGCVPTDPGKNIVYIPIGSGSITRIVPVAVGSTSHRDYLARESFEKKLSEAEDLIDQLPDGNRTFASIFRACLLASQIAKDDPDFVATFSGYEPAEGTIFRFSEALSRARRMADSPCTQTALLPTLEESITDATLRSTYLDEIKPYIRLFEGFASTHPLPLEALRSYLETSKLSAPQKYFVQQFLAVVHPVGKSTEKILEALNQCTLDELRDIRTALYAFIPKTAPETFRLLDGTSFTAK